MMLTRETLNPRNAGLAVAAVVSVITFIFASKELLVSSPSRRRLNSMMDPRTVTYKSQEATTQALNLYQQQPSTVAFRHQVQQAEDMYSQQQKAPMQQIMQQQEIPQKHPPAVTLETPTMETAQQEARPQSLQTDLGPVPIVYVDPSYRADGSKQPNQQTESGGGNTIPGLRSPQQKGTTEQGLNVPTRPSMDHSANGSSAGTKSTGMLPLPGNMNMMPTKQTTQNGYGQAATSFASNGRGGFQQLPQKSQMSMEGGKVSSNEETTTTEDEDNNASDGQEESNGNQLTLPRNGADTTGYPSQGSLSGAMASPSEARTGSDTTISTGMNNMLTGFQRVQNGQGSNVLVQNGQGSNVLGQANGMHSQNRMQIQPGSVVQPSRYGTSGQAGTSFATPGQQTQQGASNGGYNSFGKTETNDVNLGQQQSGAGPTGMVPLRQGGNKKRLEFIHVTKTGGSAIEAAAAQIGINWGACHYWEVAYEGCKNPDWDFPKSYRLDRLPVGLKYTGEPWHAPPHWQDPNRMEGAATFLVVRNPYERIVSEYYCSAYGYKGPNAHDPEVFNTWVSGNVTEVTQRLHGHMLPQHYYVYDENGKKIVNHILRYENLKEDFDNLMQEYSLPIQLPHKTPTTSHHTYKLRGKNQNQQQLMTVNDISPENIEKINEVYGLDFEYFFFPKIQMHMPAGA